MGLLSPDRLSKQRPRNQPQWDSPLYLPGPPKAPSQPDGNQPRPATESTARIAGAGKNAYLLSCRISGLPADYRSKPVSCLDFVLEIQVSGSVFEICQTVEWRQRTAQADGFRQRQQKRIVGTLSQQIRHNPLRVLPVSLLAQLIGP